MSGHRLGNRLLSYGAILALCGALGCSGDDGAAGAAGPAGPAGPAGTDGTNGDPGTNGTDGVACWDLDSSGSCEVATEDTDGDGACTVADCMPKIAYVGSETCGTCHKTEYDQFIKSGHSYKLTKVENATKPVYPFDAITGGVPDPPLGLTWSDISYVIGGFGWKVRYVGTDGYIITGAAPDPNDPNDPGELTQWNYVNAETGLGGSWVAYHQGEQKPYNCGGCHTTGWIPCDVGDTTCKHQDDMPGMAGSFFKGGVQCEACHGPGSAHVANPYMVSPKVDRSPELCGKCHIRGAVESVNASGGFIKHHEQYEELFAGKKHSMRCVDCHNPHQSAKFADATVNPDKSIRINCITCHVGYDANQNTTAMTGLNCIDCHMPKMVKSATGDASIYRGDIRSHFFKINPDATAGQFNTAGDAAMPFVSIDYGCKWCHRTGGTATVKTDAELTTSAMDYHGGQP